MSVVYDDGERLVYDPFFVGARVLVQVGDEYTPERAGQLIHYWEELDEDSFPAASYGTVRYDDGSEDDYVDSWNMSIQATS